MDQRPAHGAGLFQISRRAVASTTDDSQTPFSRRYLKSGGGFSSVTFSKVKVPPVRSASVFKNLLAR